MSPLSFPTQQKDTFQHPPKALRALCREDIKASDPPLHPAYDDAQAKGRITFLTSPFSCALRLLLVPTAKSAQGLFLLLLLLPPPCSKGRRKVKFPSPPFLFLFILHFLSGEIRDKAKQTPASSQQISDTEIGTSPPKKKLSTKRQFAEPPSRPIVPGTLALQQKGKEAHFETAGPS